MRQLSHRNDKIVLVRFYEMYQIFSTLRILGIVWIFALVRLGIPHICFQHELTARQVEASPHRSWGNYGDDSPFANQGGDADSTSSSTVAGAVQAGITTIIATTTIFQMQTLTQTQLQTQTVHQEKLAMESAMLIGIIGHGH